MLKLNLNLVSPPPVSNPLPSIAFGAAKWKEYFGDVGVEPPLPADIEKILQSPCPFWSGKTVQETHVLVLIPQTVDGKSLTPRSIGELVKAPKKGNKTQYRFTPAFQKHGDTPASVSHWVLMTRDVLPGSRGKSYDDQCKLVDRYCQRTKLPYQIPNLLDATIAIFLEYVVNGNRLYSGNPLTYTRCQEKTGYLQIAVGGFYADGLCVGDLAVNFNSDCDGVGCLRKL